MGIFIDVLQYTLICYFNSTVFDNVIHWFSLLESNNNNHDFDVM